MKKTPRKGGHNTGRGDSARPGARTLKARRQSSGRPGRRQPRASLELRVIYEDDAVVAVDKPAGLTAVPVEGTGMPSAFALVAEEMKRQRQRAYVVHRIDRFTSGVMLFAKTDRDRDALVKQFLSHTPERSIWPWFADVLRETIRKRCWSTIFAVKECFSG